MSIITQYQRNIDKKILEIANDELQVFYRGHANNKWKLETTLQRKIKEEGILNNTIASLDKTKSVFENVAHMQHYGKPTRLLDFTSNFLIALYFACSDKTQMNETGCVYVTTYRTRKVEYTDIEIIMKLSLLTEKCNILSFSSDLLSKNSKIKERYLSQGILSFQERKTDLALNILSWIDHGFMITPSKEEKITPDTANLEAYLKSFWAYGIYGWVIEWINRGMVESGEEIFHLFQAMNPDANS